MIAARVKEDPGWIANMELVIVPMSNPDGFFWSTTGDRFHRKNMKPTGVGTCMGVDLNRNAATAWSGPGASSFGCADDYYGTSAMSEPEIQALAALFDEAPMSVFIDVHSYTQLVLSSWCHTEDDHPRQAE